MEGGLKRSRAEDGDASSTSFSSILSSSNSSSTPSPTPSAAAAAAAAAGGGAAAASGGGAFHGPAADSALGARLLDVLQLVAAVGFAADVSQHVAL
jgi:hypothetical protein